MDHVNPDNIHKPTTPFAKCKWGPQVQMTVDMLNTMSEDQCKYALLQILGIVFTSDRPIMPFSFIDEIAEGIMYHNEENKKAGLTVRHMESFLIMYQMLHQPGKSWCRLVQVVRDEIARE